MRGAGLTRLYLCGDALTPARGWIICPTRSHGCDAVLQLQPWRIVTLSSEWPESACANDCDARKGESPAPRCLLLVALCLGFGRSGLGEPVRRRPASHPIGRRPLALLGWACDGRQGPEPQAIHRRLQCDCNIPRSFGYGLGLRQRPHPHEIARRRISCDGVRNRSDAVYVAVGTMAMACLT